MPLGTRHWTPACLRAAVLCVLAGLTFAAGPSGADAHWAYTPLTPSAEHRSSHGNLSARIDHHLREAATRHNLLPAGPADRTTLCRRLHIVLTGLPPTPDELHAFLRDDSPTAYETRVDRLLASPAFGERWARHWLDVVRYADSVTLRGLVFQEAWRYRDYVIDSFNRDRPVDAFIREQVAGALLPAASIDDQRRHLVASTFWVLGDANLEEQDKRQLELDVIDEQLDVLGKAFLGQTIACARCHDHKFDPIPARDYHALAGILSGVRTLVHENVSGWTEIPLPVSETEEQRWAAAEARSKKAETDLKAAKANTNAPPSKPELRALESRLAETRRAARRPHAMAPVEIGATNLPVLRRGNWKTPGEVVQRGVLTVASRTPAPAFPARDSGRLQLADWLVDPSNPMTARVFVNRAWHWVFGAGLVRSTDNFGTTGDLPSHPELLDELAAAFIHDGWSLKRLVRSLVLSEAFQRSSDPIAPAVAASLAQDAANQWLARFARRPLEAEVLRDTLLRAGDGIDSGGMGEAPMSATLAADFDFRSDSQRRSIFLPVFRNARPEGLSVFDMADPSRVTGSRERSTVAPQALYLLNNPFVHEQARAAAKAVLDAPDPVLALWLRTLARPPHPGERSRAEQHLLASQSKPQALAELAHALFGTLDFRTLH